MPNALPVNVKSNATDLSASLQSADFLQRIEQLVDRDAPRFARLWNYYRNPQLSPTTAADSSTASSVRPYRMAQEWGLPSRITGVRTAAAGASLSGEALLGISRKEVVVENDIAWRVDTMVDYLFGKPPTIRSKSTDPIRAAAIETIVSEVLANHGGTVFLQQLALLGSVYGFVDVLVKLDTDAVANIAKSVNTIDSSQDRANIDQAEALSNLTPDGRAPSQRDSSDDVQLSDASDGSVPPAAAPAPSLDSSVDVTLSVEPSRRPATTGALVPDDATLIRIARCIRLEIVEPARALPRLSPTNWRNVDSYTQVFSIDRPTGAKPRSRLVERLQSNWLTRLLGTKTNSTPSEISSAETIRVIETITPSHWARFEDDQLVASGENSLGELPLVHIQNIAVPFEYAGASDVEPLMPLQDELNTRLSDRAHRITMQSFKMYLGKGIENFGNMPVAPGRMWMTDNDAADIVEFGGDSESPSETTHINEIREAMDKTSAVTPIAAGILRDRIGQLTSAVALRVTLSALLAKTERKRTTYGGGIKRLCELSLAWLDRAGLFQTSLGERQVDIRWPNATPDDTTSQLSDAEAKLRIGVDRNVVLTELGYGAS